MADKDRRESSRYAQPVWHSPDHYEEPSEEAKKTKSPLQGNWRDQSQGPNHPVDDHGDKKPQ